METSDNILSYKIYKWSSYSANYVPENILVNKPKQQSSRWSSEGNFPPQFIVLKLKQPAVVRSITFGKYEKTHVCNLKKFKVLGGLEENHLIELLQGGLQNDSKPEIFALKYHISGHPFPCQYIKIVPILSWGTSFNFSIWHIEMHGLNSPGIVEPCLQWYYKYKSEEVIRLCLKHFREQNYTEAFEALQMKTQVRLEDSMLSHLHNILVRDGDFEKCEEIMDRAAADNIFTSYLSRQQYKPEWHQIASKSGQWPAMRGGHQLCIDQLHNCLYLFGGWNGSEDLADLWKFSCDNMAWTLLSSNTEKDGGPSARSCHKMCIDCSYQKIYTMGRYLDASKRDKMTVQNDFYVYDVLKNEWRLISEDVAVRGGPKLVFDHQMCFDDESRTIFVFGGRILKNSVRTISSGSISVVSRPLPEFSGLYAYAVDTDTWRLLREDSGNAGPQDVRSRIGHSMLLDHKHRRLYIIGGQRYKEYMKDFFYYNIEKDCVTVLNDGTQKDPGLPPSGFTQRATIDSEKNEMYMLSGLSKDRDKREENMHNSLWLYLIRDKQWSCVCRNEAASQLPHNIPAYLDSEQIAPPCVEECQPHPRYAHQLVYDETRKVHYMFGGNPGYSHQPKLRLDDLWCLRLSRPSKQDLLRSCRFQIRRQKYLEMSMQDPISALSYLQTRVSSTVDHHNEVEARKFRALTSALFGDNDLPSSGGGDRVKRSLLFSDASSSHVGRTALFEFLSAYFPQDMTQPKESLLDLLPL